MTEERFIKHGELFLTKMFLWESQNRICPLCAQHIPQLEAVMDHDHATGFLRSVLHDRCNKSLAFIETSIKFVDSKTFYDNIVEYLKLHAIKPTGLIHPRHESLTREKLKRKVKLPRLAISEQDKKLYLKALEEGPTIHPNPKKNTSKHGSWKRTADKYNINHGRLLAYVTGARSKDELLAEIV